MLGTLGWLVSGVEWKLQLAVIVESIAMAMVLALAPKSIPIPAEMEKLPRPVAHHSTRDHADASAVPKPANAALDRFMDTRVDRRSDTRSAYGDPTC